MERGSTHLYQLMSSLCKSVSQNQPELTLDGLKTASNGQGNQNRHGIQPTPRSVYWTDQIAISQPSSSNSPPTYYTALALGATVACTTGALMQYTRTGFWHQPNDITPDKVAIKAPSSNTDIAVTTPPVAAAPVAASFSQRTDRPNGSSTLQANLQALGQQEALLQKNSVRKLQSQQAILAHRRQDLARRQAEFHQKTQKIDQQFADLTAILAIHPDDAALIANLLNADTDYQLYRLRLHNLKDEIAVEYSRPVEHNPQLEVLYAQYGQALEELRQIAQDVLTSYVAHARAEFANPLWEDQESYLYLQALIDVAHFRQMHVIEHNTLTQMATKIDQRQTEVAGLLKQDLARASAASKATPS